ncbi:zinc finger protein Xfin [Culex quinquefasciatus]|uniref:Zinc finger protein Xfin n=1 Tax=Culex quinquefasciatus TaxID=7176 RepID=B0W1V9_CULQU|nr:zinc finger protein Xfin [Culex quinquefasciatus]|eukprot:XP_001842693.1 zinc finger protein Xfin [Culex quinquefasciatus]
MLLRHVIPTNNDVEEIYIVKQEDEQTDPAGNPLAGGPGPSRSGLHPTALLENEDVEIKDEPLSVQGSEEEDEKYDPPVPLLHALPVEVRLVEDLPKKLEAAIKKEKEVEEQQQTRKSPVETVKAVKPSVKQERDSSSDGDWGQDDFEPLAKEVVVKRKRGRPPKKKVEVKKEKSAGSDSDMDADDVDDDDYRPPAGSPVKKERKRGRKKKIKTEPDGFDSDASNVEETEIVKCFICVIDLKEADLLDKHLRQKHKHMLPFSCVTCVGRRVTRLKDLNLHFQQHDETRKYKCLYCAARFPSPQGQSSHMRRMHSEKYNTDMDRYRRFMCRFCDKKFTKKHDLEIHEKRHIAEESNDPAVMRRALKCYICNKFVGKNRDDLNAHVATHEDWLPYHCEKCDNKKICTVRILCEHLRQHQEGLAVKCVYCDERFVSLGECQAHERTHAAEKEAHEIEDAKMIAEMTGNSVVVVDGVKRFQCGKCDRSYALSSSLRKHQGVHAKGNAFVCSKCGRAFMKASSLALHESRNHLEGGSFTCEGCGKVFPTIGHLLDHRTRTQHFAGKPFICEGCTTTFVLQEELTEHQKTCTETEANRACFCGLCANNFPSLAIAMEHVKSEHEPEIPETKCRYCDLTFRDSERIVEHEFKHTLPGIMTCKMCNRIFKHLKNLQCHMKNHGKVAIPFMCDICGKTFTQKGTLTIHTRLHTGEKKYQCEFCDKRFAQGGQLTVHRRIHTGERPFACEKCGQRFVGGSNYKRHVKQGMCKALTAGAISSGEGGAANMHPQQQQQQLEHPYLGGAEVIGSSELRIYPDEKEMH